MTDPAIRTYRLYIVGSFAESSTIALLTGGTGLLGSHIAEQLHRRGLGVRALCRPGSDTTFLSNLGAKIVTGDLTDRDSLQEACSGVDVVYHCAARVGDWGPWKEFARISIDGTRRLLEAAVETGVRRFMHVSSISVYGHVDGEGRVLDETAPLGVNLPRWSYYGRAKVEAEKLVWEVRESGAMPVTVIRPSWLYGPRDRATLPRLIDSIRRRKLKLIGDGHNRLNLVHAGNVAEAVVLAAQSDRAIGEAYNCSHDGALTQREYFNMIAESLGEPAITRSVPFGVAKSAAFLLECFGRAFRAERPPLVTRYAVWLMGRRCFFGCDKVKEHLGWSSSIDYQTGIPAAVGDYLDRADIGLLRSSRMENIDASTTVRELLAAHPDTFAVLLGHGMCEDCKADPPAVPLEHFAGKHCGGDTAALLVELRAVIDGQSQDA